MIEKDDLLKLDLQFFADDTTDADAPDDTKDDTPDADDADDTPDDKTYTQAELDKLTSERVESAIRKRESKLEKDVEERIKKERADAIEYEKLTQKEKADADFTKRMDALEARENEINNREMLSQIESDLTESGLPKSLANSLLTLQDNEKIKESIAGIKKDFDGEINRQVKEALRQEAPEQSTGDGTIDPFTAKMNKYN